MLNVLILEDELTLAVGYKSILEKSSLVQSLNVASNAADFRKACAQTIPDLCLIDIEIGGTETGMDLAAELYHQAPSVSLVFITASQGYVRSAFGVRAMDYIPKPVPEAELLELPARVLRARSTDSGGTAICIQGARTAHRVEPSEILYIDHRGPKTQIITMHRRLETYEPLKSLTSRLPCTFVQCHRSVWVNLSHVTDLLSDSITLTGGMRCDMSPVHRKNVRQAMLNYSHTHNT